MKKYYSFALTILAAMLTLSFSSCNSREAATDNMGQLVNKELGEAVQQYRFFMKNIPDGKIPRALDTAGGHLVYCSRHDWTVGFYSGTLWYLYEYSKDTAFKNEAEEKLKIIEPLKNYKGTHDLGFMMYCSFGNGYRITQNPHYKEVLLTSAESLSTRFNDSVGCIKSWDWMKGQFPVIIDNMMNLELMCWASKNSDSAKYKDEAVSHANTTIKNHFRPDYSSFHVVVYNPETGKVMEKKTHQGFADSSAWARGQSWGLYGYTMMFRMTGDSAYLQQAEHIAHFILTNPHLPKDMVPYWDYDAPKIPDTYRDVSAASIMASALLELSTFAPDSAKAEKYKTSAEKILTSLSTPKYHYGVGEGRGFILKHSVGSLPGNAEVDVPLNYADYYYVEALLRYKNWFLNKK